eukprot:3628924-Amphidinium_carterae.1
MNDNYVEEEHIGKEIMQEFFTKMRLTDIQPGHRLWVNNKETRQSPPNLDNLQPSLQTLAVKSPTPRKPKRGSPMTLIRPTYSPVEHQSTSRHHLVWTFQFHIQKKWYQCRNSPLGHMVRRATQSWTWVEVDKPTEVYKPTHRLT